MDCQQAAVEVWGWLQPLWNVGANVTSLFDWKAWAALGTTAAVFLALRRDDRADRRAWMGERAVLIALAQYAETVPSLMKSDKDMFPIFADADYVPDSKNAKAQADREIEMGYIRMSLDGLNAIKMTDLTTAQSITKWMIAKAAVTFVLTEVSKVSRGEVANGGACKNHATQLEKAGAAWRKEAETLLKRAHPIAARVPVLRKRL